MKWKTWNKRGERRNKKMKWRKWFAWYPVVVAIERPGYSVCRHWAWLEWVERKGLDVKFIWGLGWSYEYREVQGKE